MLEKSTYYILDAQEEHFRVDSLTRWPISAVTRKPTLNISASAKDGINKISFQTT